MKIPILEMVYAMTFKLFSFNKMSGRKINSAKFFMVMETAIKVNFFKSPLYSSIGLLKKENSNNIVLYNTNIVKLQK